MTRYFAMFGLCLLTCGTAQAQRVDSGVQYGPGAAQTLDLYHPAAAAPALLVVFLHGGGWQGGDKKLGQQIAPPLLAGGYALASLDYPLWPSAPPASALQSAALGIAYLLHNAQRFGLRTDKFAVMGHSSGSTMAALLGTDSSYLRKAGVDPGKLVAVATLDGAFDMKAMLTEFPKSPAHRPFGDDQSVWAQYSPVVLVAQMQASPRFCVVHEDVVPKYVEQAGLLEAALKTHGTPEEAETVHGLRHAELAWKFPDAGQPMAPFVIGCLGRAFGL